MPIEITMPALSPTMTEGNLVKWVKKEGDKIKSGDIIAEIETDKATMEFEVSNNGVVGKIIIPEGTEGVKVNTLIAILLKDGESPSVLENYSPTVSIVSAVKVVADQKEEQGEILENKIHSESAQKVFISPLARRMAENNATNIEDIKGSGPRGRIVKVDVEKYFANAGGDAKSHNTEGNGGYKLVPHSSVRRVIAKRLVESKQQVPHFYLSLEVEMNEANECRAKINKALEKFGTKISINDFIIKASAIALREFPSINASWHETGMMMYDNVDISVAVSVSSGLITPIVRNADRKSIWDISNEVKLLVQKAKENKLKPEEFQGGGFSISNLGMYNITNFNAIINPPQSAILAVGTASKKPVFSDKTKDFVPMDVMNLTLSADHRVVDGTLGAEFLNKIKFYIENPILFSVFTAERNY